MKSFIYSVAAALLLFPTAMSPTGCSPKTTEAPAESQTLFQVAIPASLEEPMRKTIAKAIIDLVAAAKTGDRIELFDAQNLKSIVSFERPEGRTPRAIVRRLSRELGVAGQFLKTAVTTEPGVAGHNAIRHPQILEMMGTSRVPGMDTRCILFGSAFYRDPADAAFAMGDGLYPSDGHLLASATGSIYSCVGKETLLKGVPVYFCYLEEGFHSTLERDAVRRWWSVYVGSGLGGALSHSSASAPNTVEAALRGVKTPADASARIDRSDTRVEMRRAGAKVTVPVVAVPDLVAVASRIPLPEKGKAQLITVWKSGGKSSTDVDIWLTPQPGAEEISFKNQKTPEGRLLRDIRQPPPIGDGSEWLSVWEVVEVKEAALRQTTAWLNLYKNGGGQGVEGLVRVAFAGRTADLPFAFAPGPGDGAAGRNRREGDPSWLRIDMAAALSQLESAR